MSCRAGPLGPKQSEERKSYDESLLQPQVSEIWAVYPEPELDSNLKKTLLELALARLLKGVVVHQQLNKGGVGHRH